MDGYKEANKVMEGLSWTCHICGRERPDTVIKVYTRDVSEKYNLPVGTMRENIRYCGDSVVCQKGAETFNFVKEV